MIERSNLEQLAFERFDRLRDDLLYAWTKNKVRSDDSAYSLERLVSDLKDLCVAYAGLSDSDAAFLGESVACEFEDIAALLRFEEILGRIPLRILLESVGWTVFIDMDFGAMDRGPLRYSPGMLRLQRERQEPLDKITWLENQFKSA